METINKIVDWIVSESCEDICQICANYNKEEQARDFADGEEPCSCRRVKGKIACREGIINHFEMR